MADPTVNVYRYIHGAWEHGGALRSHSGNHSGVVDQSDPGIQYR